MQLITKILKFKFNIIYLLFIFFYNQNSYSAKNKPTFEDAVARERIISLQRKDLDFYSLHIEDILNTFNQYDYQAATNDLSLLFSNSNHAKKNSAHLTERFYFPLSAMITYASFLNSDSNEPVKSKKLHPNTQLTEDEKTNYFTLIQGEFNLKQNKRNLISLLQQFLPFNEQVNDLSLTIDKPFNSTHLFELLLQVKLIQILSKDINLIKVDDLKFLFLFHQIACTQLKISRYIQPHEQVQTFESFLVYLNTNSDHLFKELKISLMNNKLLYEVPFHELLQNVIKIQKVKTLKCEQLF